MEASGLSASPDPTFLKRVRRPSLHELTAASTQERVERWLDAPSTGAQYSFDDRGVNIGEGFLQCIFCLLQWILWPWGLRWCNVLAGAGNGEAGG